MAATETENSPRLKHRAGYDPEKGDRSHIDDASNEGATVKGLDNDDEEFTLEEQRKIIHRVDRRLILTTGIMYCISLMDRTNLSAAAIAGMIVDLELGVQARYVSHWPVSVVAERFVS